MRNPCLFVPLIASFAVATAGCVATESQSQGPPSATMTSSPALDVRPADVSDESFCHALRQAGIANTAALETSADPATLLPALDALVPAAPPAISDDFATFDHLEHVLLGPAGDPTAARGANAPESRAALTHVAAYLHDTCHVTG